MINFDSVDFSERRPEEVISFFWRSVYFVLLFCKFWQNVCLLLLSIIKLVFLPLNFMHGIYTKFALKW